jgi:hypothetical protein
MRHALATFLLLILAIPAAAQELESLAGIRLNFEQPGARAVAMGGAAAGNPADLAGAARSFSLEARRRSSESRYVSDEQLNTIGLSSTTSGITSASLVVPRGRTTWSASYDVPLDIEHSTTPIVQRFNYGQLFLCNGRVSATICSAASPPHQFEFPVTLPVDASLRLERFSAGGAWSAGPLALGATARYERLKQRTAAQVPYPLAETIDDSDVTWSAGARWRLSSRVSVGGAYESGGAFGGERSFVDSPSQTIELHTPSSLRGGVLVDVLPRLTVAADAVRVNYSEMNHAARSTFPDQSELGYADVTELRAGLEYRLGGIALRAGWWRDPAHSFAVLNGITPPGALAAVAAIVDEDEDHVTAGLGIGRGAVRLDASVDRGSRSTRAAVGVTTRF